MLPLGDGVRLRVRDRGKGPAILLVHGFTGSIEAWGADVPATLVSAGSRVVAVDLPGHGRSDVPVDPRRYALHRVVADLVEVLDGLDIAEADWIGYSMGGRIALGATVMQPSRVRSLVLEGASPGFDDEQEAARRRELDEERARRILVGGMERFVDEWMAQPLFHSQRRLPAEVLRLARERRLACDPAGLANTLRGLGVGSQPSFWSELTSVGVPTLLLTGARDRKFTRIAGRMAQLMPFAGHCTIPDAGHTVHLERPRAWLREVTAFLGRVRRRPNDDPSSGRNVHPHSGGTHA